MIAYGTVYSGGFHATIWARSEIERDVMIAARGLGELPCDWCSTDYPLTSELFEQAMKGEPVRNVDVAHGLVFLEMLAVSCGLPHGLHDTGWHHEAIHWLAMRSGPEWTLTLERIREIERSIPGHTRQSLTLA